MMRPKSFSFAPITPSANGICLSQTPAGAGNLLLNGALAQSLTLVDFNPRSASTGALPTGLASYKIDFTSAGNDSGVNLTITGTDPDGKAQTELLAGPNANTVTSLKYFKTITQIAISGAAAAALTSGINAAGQFVSQSVCLDIYEPYASIAVDITGTITYHVEKAFERLTAGEVVNWVPGGLATQTADANVGYNNPTGAVRLRAQSYSTGALAVLRVVQGRNF